MFSCLAWQAGETTNGSAGASGMIIHALKLIIRYVLVIQRHIKLALYFCARPFCISKKTNKLRVCLRINGLDFRSTLNL